MQQQENKKTGTTKPYAPAKPKTPRPWKQEHTMP
jgi:hypothetical protein